MKNPVVQPMTLRQTQLSEPRQKQTPLAPRKEKKKRKPKLAHPAGSVDG
jgi:hypothetical protein